MNCHVSDQQIEQFLKIAVDAGLGDGGFYGPDASFSIWQHHPFKDMTATDVRRLLAYNQRS